MNGPWGFYGDCRYSEWCELFLRVQGNLKGMALFYTLIKKMLTHQGQFLVTGLHRSVSPKTLACKNIPIAWIFKPPRFYKCYPCLFTRQKVKSSLTKLALVCFKKYLSECTINWTEVARALNSIKNKRMHGICKEYFILFGNGSEMIYVVEVASNL